jgi:methylmalonyl-CoA mutase N-terminal domain/subunit
MRERFGARNPKSWQLRFHAQTAGVSLTAQQPSNNVVRTAVQALAAVLGGAQSLHTNALDEALALPTEEAALLALRTQQILAHETGLADVVDPLGGSYCVERLTADLEAEARRQFDVIDGMGGMVAAIEAGYPQREIAESAYRDQQAVESKARTIVGRERLRGARHEPVRTLYIDEGGRNRTAGGAGTAANGTRCGPSPVGARRRPGRGRGLRKHHAAPAGGGSGLRDGRRNVRRSQTGLGRIRREPDNLEVARAAVCQSGNRRHEPLRLG